MASPHAVAIYSSVMVFVAVATPISPPGINSANFLERRILGV